MNLLRHNNFLQANLNHSAGAQDLFLQSMAEWGVNVAVACEPYYVPSHTHWAGDIDGLVAVTTRVGSEVPLSTLERGLGYVVAGWGEYAIVGVYFSPNRSLAEFEVFLDSVRAAICRWSPRPLLVLGDLNAKAQEWGNPTTDPRGRAVQEWAVLCGLSLLNRGDVHTCVRHTGGSVVDISFATPAIARRISDWRVESGVETLSDHLYVRFGISAPTGQTDPPGGPSCFPRWALSRLDRELAGEAAIVQRWASSRVEDAGVDQLAGRIRSALQQVCDAAMPRVRRRPGYRRVYWWSAEIGDLRVACGAARREYVRCRRQNGRDPVLEARLKDALYQAREALKLAICRAKERADGEVLAELDRDPWGRPYRAARKKLRGRGAPPTETLPPDLLGRIMGELFPAAPENFVPPRMTPPVLEEDGLAAPPTIEEEEMDDALDRLRTRRRAPGPDGVPGAVVYLAAGPLRDRIRELFGECLRTGQFPDLWREGRVCLLPKEGRPPELPSAYRPIVLLDEVGKLLERILVSRLVRHLEEVGPRLSEAQWGFRAGRSTMDALDQLKGLSREAVERGEILLAVSLDVRNAFNSLPFETLGEALRYHRVPLYLRRLLLAYLRDRRVVWEGRSGGLSRRAVERGVPQGSVLGPTLWNIGFDWLLRGPLLPGMRVICYADDTLITVRGKSWEEVARRATVGTSLVVERVHQLGLRVALDKTEALLFHGPRRGPPRGAQIVVRGEAINVKAQMKYLGLILDGRWGFKAHFAQLAPKLVSAAAALGRLLPNVGGPKSACRRLYSGIIRSMALYGAPIWAEALTADNKILLRRPQRIIAVRAIRGYRTVSWTAATLLAGEPPWELQAEVLAAVYRLRAEGRVAGAAPDWDMVRRTRRRCQEEVVLRWGEQLASPAYGRETVEAVRPHLASWLKRGHGALSYRLTQVLTGHGCFGKYLHQIAGREPTPICHACGAPVDTARHTLEECVAWGPRRHDLVSVVGRDLSLRSVVEAMLSSERCWRAMASFCESVMAQKEAAERVREGDAQADPLRRARRGRRRRRYAHLLPPP